MIPVSALLGDHVDGDRTTIDLDDGDVSAGDPAEYTETEVIASASRHSPAVDWFITDRCNLECRRCEGPPDAPGEADALTPAEGRRLLSDLADFGVTTVRLAGGQPLCRDDLLDLVGHASDLGLRPVLSTNGTLMTPERARALAAAGLAAVDVSVAGLVEGDDEYRGVDGAFTVTLEGVQACLRAGLSTGLSYTATAASVADLQGVFDTFRAGGVDRFRIAHCHPNRTAVGGETAGLTTAERRAVVRTVCDRSVVAHHGADPIETVLLGNHADAGFLVEFAHERFGAAAARRVHERLGALGGAPAGRRTAAIDPRGHVRPGRCWRTYSLGNVRDRSFADLWTDDTNPVLAALRAPEDRLTGRCADCRYRSTCGGASRRRALADGAGLFGPDPQCYLRAWERRGPPPTADAD